MPGRTMFSVGYVRATLLNQDSFVRPVQWKVCGVPEMGICHDSDPWSGPNLDNRSFLKMTPVQPPGILWKVK